MHTVPQVIRNKPGRCFIPAPSRRSLRSEEVTEVTTTSRPRCALFTNGPTYTCIYIFIYFTYTTLEYSGRVAVNRNERDSFNFPRIAIACSRLSRSRFPPPCVSLILAREIDGNETNSAPPPLPPSPPLYSRRKRGETFARIVNVYFYYLFFCLSLSHLILFLFSTFGRRGVFGGCVGCFHFSCLGGKLRHEIRRRET